MRNIIHDERGQYDQREIDMMADANIQVEQPEKPSEDQQSKKESLPDYLKNGWHYDERITKILEGSRKDLPTNFRRAMPLVLQRFGCVYKKLQEELLHNTELLLEATVQSSGHELAHAPEKMRANLPPAFFIEAMQRGVRGWIIKWASEEVRRDKRVQKLAVEDHPAFAEYLIDPDQEILDLISDREEQLRKTLNG